MTRTGLDRLLWLEPFWIALLAPAVLLPGRFWILDWHPYLVLLLLLFWPLRLLRERRLGAPTPLDWPFWLLLVQAGVAVAVSPERNRSWEAAGYLLVGAAAYVALVNWPPLRRRPPRTAWIVLAVGAALAAIGPFLLNSIPGKVSLVAGLAGPASPHAGPLAGALSETINPNVLASALLLVAPLCLALALGPRWTAQPGVRVLWGVAALLVYAELILTQSRGAWFAAALAVLLLLVLRWPRLRWLALVALVAGVALLPLAGLALLVDTVGGTADGAGSGYGLNDRLEIWQRAVWAQHDYPLAGIGLGLFDRVIPVRYPYPRPSLGAGVPHAHNLLLQVGVDLGVPGLVFYLALLLVVAAMLVHLLRRRPGAGEREAREPDTMRRGLCWSLAAGAAAALTAMLVHGLVDTPLWGMKLAFLPWLIIALVTNLFLEMNGPRNDVPSRCG